MTHVASSQSEDMDQVEKADSIVRRQIHDGCTRNQYRHNDGTVTYAIVNTVN